MNELKDVTYQELKTIINESNVTVVMAHTPTCGTCVVAKKMLQIISATLTQVPIVAINLNYNEQMAKDFEIMSVPCILIYKNTNCVEKIYAFQSVPYLYKKITHYL
ncbi:MAG TPA: thioredoxin [Firmicutes bacterium]|nr:thioredoxin [Bacillota bacterium]